MTTRHAHLWTHRGDKRSCDCGFTQQWTRRVGHLVGYWRMIAKRKRKPITIKYAQPPIDCGTLVIGNYSRKLTERELATGVIVLNRADVSAANGTKRNG